MARPKKQLGRALLPCQGRRHGRDRFHSTFGTPPPMLRLYRVMFPETDHATTNQYNSHPVRTHHQYLHILAAQRFQNQSLHSHLKPGVIIE